MNVVEKASRKMRLIDANALIKEANAEGAYGYVDAEQIANAPTIDVEKISDGYHTFADLYEQRLILSAALAKNNPHAWKSKRHEDGSDPFGGGWFIMGFDTDEGCYTYHYELKDWDLFQCKELDKGKPWDGHTSKDVRRLLPIPAAVSVPQWISVKDGMPENEKQVILLRRNGKVSRAEVRKIGASVRFRLYSEEDDYSPVTHWAAFPAMPLPEPPKGESEQ
nr:MAG TPA: Protein of unknown function (DUF551) [Caudoviricetes sp.]